MKKEFTAKDLNEMRSAADQIKELLPDHGVVLFQGEMGAGKTTLIKYLCSSLGIQDEVSSPTFALVNEYLLPEGDPMYHFDLYRMEDPEEALDIGIEDYFDQPALCFVEWPDRLGYLLPEKTLEIHIEDEGNLRRITFSS